MNLENCTGSASKICHIALQPRYRSNCSDPQGIRLPTKLPFLSKIDITSDVFARHFLQTFGYFLPEKNSVPSSSIKLHNNATALFNPPPTPPRCGKNQHGELLAPVHSAACTAEDCTVLQTLGGDYTKYKYTVPRPAQCCGGRFAVVRVRDDESIPPRLEGPHGACRVEGQRRDP